MSERILVIDDDERLAAMVVSYLGARGLAADARHDATGGLIALARGGYDAVVLDVMLPDLDGFEVLRRLRAGAVPGGEAIPIIMLTARGEETDRVVGLEMGANDYLPKPFSPRELLARLRAVLRRASRPAQSASAPTLRFGRLEINAGARQVRLDGEARRLTSHQFALLLALAESAGRVLSRDQLMESVRGEELSAFDRSIDVHISRIRAAIEDDARRPRRILTVRGVGYVFTANQD